MKKFFKLIFSLLFLIVASFSAVITVQGYQLYQEALAAEPIKQKFDAIMMQPDFVEIDELPELYKHSIISIEDEKFYSHSGININSIIRAFKTNIFSMKYVEGGSTITQQIAKNQYFTQEKKLTRKIAEVFMAKEIEKNYSKDEIFEIYVNTIYFGEGYYGIAQASKGYYDVTPSEMNDYQSTMLAGVPNAPSLYAPTVNLELAQKRQKQVLDKLVEDGVITDDEATKIKNNPQ